MANKESGADRRRRISNSENALKIQPKNLHCKGDKNKINKLSDVKISPSVPM